MTITFTRAELAALRDREYVTDDCDELRLDGMDGYLPFAEVAAQLAREVLQLRRELAKAKKASDGDGDGYGYGNGDGSAVPHD